MQDLRLANPKDVMVQQLATLRGYASMVLLHGESLSDHQMSDHAVTMQQFLTVGESYDLTPKEMVELVLGEVFMDKRECGCHSCKSRGQA